MPSNLQDRVDAVKLAATSRTFRRYGLDDLFREQSIAPSAPGVYNKLVTFGKHIGEMGRDAYLGSPITMAQKIQRHYRDTGSAPRAVGRYVKNWYLDPNTPLWIRALSIGVPLYGLGSTLAADSPEKRPGDLAGGILGLAAAPLTSRLGDAGLSLQAGVQNAGRRGIEALSGAEHRPNNSPTVGTSDVTE